MNAESPREATNERRVLLDAAEREFTAHNLDAAKQLYLHVVSCSDDSEACDFTHDGVRCVRLLTSNDFVHYVHWMKQDGRDDALRWVPSVRATALWRLGYICAEQREFQEAIAQLERARRVLPRSAGITVELAFCHGMAGDHETALSLYESIGSVGYHVTARNKAASLRGAGAQLTELGKLDSALSAYRESLRYEESRLALQEIAYLEHLRSGGKPVHGDTTRSGSEGWRCTRCGEDFADGFSGMRDGRVIQICQKCERRTHRAWWQFWLPRRPPLLGIRRLPDRGDRAPD